MIPTLPYYLRDVKRAEKKALFTVISLFAGAGGSSTGYRLAGGTVLAANEFVELARDTYHANYPSTLIIPDDIRKLTGKDILKKVGLRRGELDILDGSPPCASFSTAGKREKAWGQVKKYSDTKQRVDDLFFEFARILKEVQPRAFVAENVKGLTVGVAKSILGSKMKGFTPQDTIVQTLIDCGYRVAYKVLNAADYGTPQQRERTIFIGVRKDLKAKPSHPERLVSKYITLGDAIEDLKNEEEGLELDDRFKVDQVLLKLKQGEDGSKILGEGKFFSVARLHRDRPSRTLVISSCKNFCHYSEDRRLSVLEAKRIMSFPDDFKLIGATTKQWERLARAVPPFMMKAIAEHVYETILCAE